MDKRTDRRKKERTRYAVYEKLEIRHMYGRRKYRRAGQKETQNDRQKDGKKTSKKDG